MMSDKDFVNAIWDKYNKYDRKSLKKDTFLKKFKYRNMHFNRRWRLVCSSVMILAVMTGVGYAGITSYKNKFIQRSTTTDFYKNRGYDYNQDMICSNGIYYKKIYNYNEYLEAKKRWDNLVDMQESDFEDSFVMILAGENYSTVSLYVSNIYVENETMCIEMRKKDKWNIEDTTISVNVSKDLDRKMVEIKKVSNSVDTAGKYKDLNEITKEYSVDEALKDNCFVIKGNKILSNNKKELDDFINDCNEKTHSVIRMYIRSNNSLSVMDMEYKDGKINSVSKYFNYTNNEEEMYYRTGNKIVKYKDEDNYTNYLLYDEAGKNMYIAIIEF